MDKKEISSCKHTQSGISIMQPNTVGATKREIQFNSGPFEGAPKLPDQYSIVPATSINVKQVDTPIKPLLWEPNTNFA